MLQVRGDHRMQASPTFHAGHRGHRLEQVADTVKGLAAQSLEAQRITKVRLSHEGGVSRPGCGVDAQDLSAHSLRVTAVVKVITVGESDPVKRVQ